MLDDPGSGRSVRAEARRKEIVEVAMRRFAERGYQHTRVEDIATEFGISKSLVFKHFRSKECLFFECFKRAVTSLPAWLDVPSSVSDTGFFAVLSHWLDHPDRLFGEDWVPSRVVLMGLYVTDLPLKREINRFMVSEDPYDTLEFVEFGIHRGEVRSDISVEVLASLIDWIAGRFQDAVLSEELDPGIFHRRGVDAERRARWRGDFMELLRSAVRTPAEDPTHRLGHGLLGDVG